MSDVNPPSPSENGNGADNGYQASGADSADAGYAGSNDGAAASSSDAGDSGSALWQRCLYMLGYGILAYFTFWVLIVMAIVQLIVVAIDKKPNSDLRRFARNTVQYLWELLAYLVFASDDRPFPFGPFPNIPE